MTVSLPEENLYGHTKKLRYILAQVEDFRRARGGRLRLLDFGCGNGEAVSRYLIQDGIDYTGIDLHEPSLRHARERFGGPRARFVSKLPEGEPYDVLLCADVIEHLPDPMAVLAEQGEHLAEDGLLIGAVPNGWGPFELEGWIATRTGLARIVAFVMGFFLRVKYRIFGWPEDPGPPPPYNAENGHVQFFTRSSLRRTLAGAGYEIEDFQHGAFMGSLVSAWFLKGRILTKANNAIADRLPAWAVSTWYFTASKLPKAGVGSGGEGV